jgi:mono/diheme cytochrome c family protein
MRKVIAWALAGLLLGVGLVGTPSATMAVDGKQIYTDKCLPCHGEKGDGKGAMAAVFNPPPTSFIDSKFWQNDVEKKITNAVTNGKGKMMPMGLKDEEIKAVSAYMKQTFKK